MALTATIYNFDIDLSDVDRGVYETLSFKLARQPSETEEYMLTRVLAYCHEYCEGIAFSGGIVEPDEPSISIRDLTGTLLAWIDVGVPDAARLHKAAKAAKRVAVYTHRKRSLLTAIEGAKIHRIEDLELYAVDPAILEALTERLDRRNRLALSIADGSIFATVGDTTVEGSLQRI